MGGLPLRAELYVCSLVRALDPFNSIYSRVQSLLFPEYIDVPLLEEAPPICWGLSCSDEHGTICSTALLSCATQAKLRRLYQPEGTFTKIQTQPLKSLKMQAGRSRSKFSSTGSMQRPRHTLTLQVVFLDFKERLVCPAFCSENINSNQKRKAFVGITVGNAGTCRMSAMLV